MIREKKVSVFVATYNHKDYIAQALESILMQEVTFPYEIIIHDDASTDGTAEIVKTYEERYPNIIKSMHQTENQFSQGNITATWECMLSMCTGKYCALLNGDDYWTDKEKLQRQYNYMEAHPECSLYIHNAVRLDVRTGEEVILNTFPRSGYYSQRDQVLCGLGSKFPAAGSYFFVMDYFRKNVPDFIYKAGIGDYPYRQFLADKGEVYYDERPMSVYRYMTKGSFMSNLNSDVAAYLTYICRISLFYKKFNEYTEYRFDDVFSEKIKSDLLGYAAATYENRGRVNEIEDSTMRDIIELSYKLLDGEIWVDELQANLANGEAVWIYGTSLLAKICKRTLESVGIKIKGFVISDGYSKVDDFEGYPVVYFSETKGTNAFYVVAVQPINKDSIQNVLEASQESRYFFSYAR